MEQHLFLKLGKSYSKIFVSEILYARAERKYIHITTKTQTFFIRGSIGMIEDSLQKQQFYRIHKSYLVSLNHITGFDKKVVFIGDKKLPIGRHYKIELFRKLFSSDVA
jgi:DNA-binding LytR/AlgR family response regulator